MKLHVFNALRTNPDSTVEELAEKMLHPQMMEYDVEQSDKEAFVKKVQECIDYHFNGGSVIRLMPNDKYIYRLKQNSIFFPEEIGESVVELSNQCYDKWCKSDTPYVRLVRSSHWASQGYWIEFIENEVKSPDFILKERKL